MVEFVNGMHWITCVDCKERFELHEEDYEAWNMIDNDQWASNNAGDWICVRCQCKPSAEELAALTPVQKKALCALVDHRVSTRTVGIESGTLRELLEGGYVVHVNADRYCRTFKADAAVRLFNAA